MTSTTENLGGGVVSVATPDPVAEAIRLSHVERRSSSRMEGSCRVAVFDLDGRELTRTRADNISGGGLQMTVPVGYGFAIGQRYEVCIMPDDASALPSHILGEGHYATAVRTRIVLSGGQDCVAVAMRFDQPLVM